MATKKGSVRQRATATALDLAAKRGWDTISLNDIARAGKMTLAELYGEFSSKQAILEAFSRDIDMKVLAGLGEAGADETPRDRLFDVVMRRIDALEPHKAAIESIVRAAGRDPIALVCGLGSAQHSMACMLEAAGISTAGLTGVIRVNGLAALYGSVLRTWFSDESPDKARTMAALDRGLRRAEDLLTRLGRRRRPAAA